MTTTLDHETVLLHTAAVKRRLRAIKSAYRPQVPFNAHPREAEMLAGLRELLMLQQQLVQLCSDCARQLQREQFAMR